SVKCTSNDCRFKCIESSIGRKQMWKTVVPWMAVTIFAVIIVFQRTTITSLQEQLRVSNRIKRSVDSSQNVIFLPVFAQLSKKALQRMCLNRAYRGRGLVTLEDSVSAMNIETTTSTSSTTPMKRRKPIRSWEPPDRKRCSSAATLSDPQLIGFRPNTVGAALRDGYSYYVTEFNIGYSILSFPSGRSLNNSEPKSIFTLPYPFHGTDNTVYNRTAYYNYEMNVISFNMRTEYTKVLRLNISKEPLYNNSSSSRMDIQADEHGLWVMYRRNGEKYLTVSRIQPISLKVLSTWPLQAILPEYLCNAFIRCGLLYTVTCGVKHVTVSADYDFYEQMYVSSIPNEWSGMASLSSVQYDPNSKTITIFDTGKVYSVTAS
uniref:Olfactomedin-like domain-containing protein n=1 Tax=Haemonchus contortus TaxID=6289 RepID=A0A7I4XV42_HAECO